MLGAWNDSFQVFTRSAADGTGAKTTYFISRWHLQDHPFSSPRQKWLRRLKNVCEESERERLWWHQLLIRTLKISQPWSVLLWPARDHGRGVVSPAPPPPPSDSPPASLIPVRWRDSCPGVGMLSVLQVTFICDTRTANCTSYRGQESIKIRNYNLPSCRRHHGDPLPLDT